MSASIWQGAAVGLGAAVGGVLRWSAGLWLNPVWGGFPLGTLLVNGLGGLLIGLLAAWFLHHPDELLRALLITGVLGGFTTFSAFSMESLLLLERGQWTLALLHAVAHVLGALLCAAAGWWLGQRWIGGA